MRDVFRGATLALLVALGAMLLVAGCARSKKPDGQAAASINIKGSDTMVNLVSNLAEAYMQSHPGANIAVTGGGSGTGIAALINGTTELCASSRALKPEEMEAARARGVAPREIVIGQDGLAVMVHTANPVAELTLEQLRKIYTGEYTRWDEVGGSAQPIVVLSRESNSGTYVYFQEHVLEKKDFTPRARLLPSTAAITQALTGDQWAIGYGGIAYAEHASVKMISVKKDAASPAVVPSEATVLEGSYPISRPLFLYTNGEPQGLVKAFIDFALSAEGQKILVETGYVPVKK